MGFRGRCSGGGLGTIHVVLLERQVGPGSAAGGNHEVTRLLQARGLVLVGTISYGSYLVLHILCLNAAARTHAESRPTAEPGPS